MDFGFDETQELLRSATRTFLAEHEPLAVVRRRLEDTDVVDTALWRRGAELGWTAMLVPSDLDGGAVTAQPLVDAIVLAEELGRALNPGPFVPCNVVADALARFGSAEQAGHHLPSLARGETTAGWCLSGDGSPDPESVAVRARAVPGGWRLDGVSRFVQASPTVSLLLVVALDEEDSVRSFLVTPPAAGLSVRTVRGIDLTRRFAEIGFDGVTVAAADELGGGTGTSVVERCLSVATVLQAGESVGAAEMLFEATVDYLKTRVQFGRTIGSFQAVKHRLADLKIELEGMRVAAEYAALALGDGLEDAAEAVATAGAFVDDTFAHVCGEALQLHGGIGFTWEHDVHLFVRRAKANQVLHGDGAWHRERLVRLAEAATVPEGGA